MQARNSFMTREEVAKAWFDEEYEPIAQMLREVGLTGEGTETGTEGAMFRLQGRPLELDGGVARAHRFLTRA